MFLGLTVLEKIRIYFTIDLERDIVFLHRIDILSSTCNVLFAGIGKPACVRHVVRRFTDTGEVDVAIAWSICSSSGERSLSFNV